MICRPRDGRLVLNVLASTDSGFSIAEPLAAILPVDRRTTGLSAGDPLADR